MAQPFWRRRQNIFLWLDFLSAARLRWRSCGLPRARGTVGAAQRDARRIAASSQRDSQRLAPIEHGGFQPYLETVFPRYFTDRDAKDPALKQTFMDMAHTVGQDAGLRQMRALLAIKAVHQPRSHPLSDDDYWRSGGPSHDARRSRGSGAERFPAPGCWSSMAPPISQHWNSLRVTAALRSWLTGKSRTGGGKATFRDL